MAAIVLDAAAIAHFAHHFQVIKGALLQALGFQEHLLILEVSQALSQFQFDVLHHLIHALIIGNVVLGGVDIQAVQLAQHLACHAVEAGDVLHLIAKVGDAVAVLIAVGG